MKNKTATPGIFSPETLYIFVRTWVLDKAPFPVLDINVSDIVNAQGMSFHMSDDVPPVYSGRSYESFGAYSENLEDNKNIPENSTAWFVMHLSRIKTKEDIDRFRESIRAMLTWMHLLEYLVLDPDNGYLATQKLLDNGVFLKTA